MPIWCLHQAKAGLQGRCQMEGQCVFGSEMQDAWVIGDGSRVFLSRSIRRVEVSWSRYLQCFRGLGVPDQFWWKDCALKEACDLGRTKGQSDLARNSR